SEQAQLASGTRVVVAPLVSNVNIAKHASVGLVAVGQDLTYTVTVTNLSGAPIAGVAVVDPLPAPLLYRSSFGDHGLSCSASVPAPVTVACNGGSIPNGETGIITILTTVGSCTVSP